MRWRPGPVSESDVEYLWQRAAAPGRFTSQIATLEYALENQQVVGNALLLELYTRFSGVSPFGDKAEVIQVQADIEIIAIHPTYASDYSLEVRSMRALDTGVTASAQRSFQSPSGLPFAFTGLTRFGVYASDGATSWPAGPGNYGVNLGTFSYAIGASPGGAPGDVDLEVKCTAEGSPRSGLQETACLGQHLLVFADPKLAQRPTKQPRGSFTETVGADDTQSVAGGAPLGLVATATPCALAGFQLQVAPDFKPNSMLVECKDCDNVFNSSGAFSVGIQGDSFMDNATMGPDQSSMAFCPEPAGAPYACLAKPQWTGRLWLDSAMFF